MTTRHTLLQRYCLHLHGLQYTCSHCHITQASRWHDGEDKGVSHALTSTQQAKTNIFFALVQFSGCATDPKTWQPAVGATEASALVACLVGYLATKCALFPTLAELLLAAGPPASAGQQLPAMSLPEALASNLTVRFLSLRRHPEVAAAQLTLSRLLCVPLLWLRCPTVLLNVCPLSRYMLPDVLKICCASLACHKHVNSFIMML